MKCYRKRFQINHSYWAVITTNVSTINKQRYLNTNVFFFVIGKYQDCFMDDKQLKDYVFPFLNVDDPYEVTKEDILRTKWLDENKILHGQFKPA